MPLEREPGTRPARRAKGTGANFVYEGLRRAILELEIPPGALLDETQLSLRFSVSRSPVREALVRLGARGLVETLPNRSAVVAPLRMESVAPLLSAHEVLYRLTARAAAMRSRLADLGPVEAIQDRLEELARRNDLYAMVGLNSEFHERVAALSGNAWYTAWMHSLLDEGYRLRHLHLRVCTPAATEGDLNHHRAMISAIRAGDMDGADDAARRDVEIMRLQMVDLVSRNDAANLRLQ